MKDRLEQIYEKKYGIRLPSSDMLKKKPGRRLKLTYNNKSDDDLDFSGKGRSIEDQRKKIWLTIARKDIPRVKKRQRKGKKKEVY